MIGLLQVCYISEWVFPDEPHWQQLRAHEGWREARRDTRQRVCIFKILSALLIKRRLGMGRYISGLSLLRLNPLLMIFPIFEIILCYVLAWCLMPFFFRFELIFILKLIFIFELMMSCSSSSRQLESPCSHPILCIFLCLVQYWWPLIT